MTIQSIVQDPTNIRSLFHQRHQDLKAVAGAVQSGDIAGAQTALVAYQKDVQAIQAQSGQAQSGQAQSGQSGQPAGHPGGSKLQSDLSSLTTAIQGGNITNAQGALQAYQQDSGAPGIAPQSNANGSGASSFVQDLTKFVQDTAQGSSSAEADGSALATDLQNLFGGGVAPQTGATQSSSQSQPASAASSFVQDLTKLVNDTKNGNASSVQADAASLKADVQGLSSGAQASGVHGHHHHHGGEGGEGASSAGQQTAPAQPSLLTALGNDGDGDDASATPAATTTTGAAATGTAAVMSAAVQDPAAAAIAEKYQLSQTLLSGAFGSSQTISL